MKQTIAAVAIVFVGIVWADEASDRTGVEHTIRTLNDATTEVEARKLATPEAYSELTRLLDFNTRPWSEVSRPHFIIQAVRFIGPDVALLDAASTQYGTWIPARRIPLVLMMRREGNVWRIAFVRILVADP